MNINKNLDKKNQLQSDKIKTGELMNDNREQEWLKENKEAIDKQNERIKKYGCFSDAYRRF